LAPQIKPPEKGCVIPLASEYRMPSKRNCQTYFLKSVMNVPACAAFFSSVHPPVSFMRNRRASFRVLHGRFA
jgi:hypothetical protein